MTIKKAKEYINIAIKTVWNDKIYKEIIETLELEPTTGHWIADIDKWGNIVTTVNGYRCNRCNVFNSDKNNYCPNCGCRMIDALERSEVKK